MQSKENSNLPPTPEQIAAAQTILDQARSSQGTTVPPGQKEESAVKPSEQEAVIPAKVVAELTTLFTATMANPDFFTKESRVVALRSALKVPMFDDRSMQQFAVSAKEELTQKAMDLACDTNTVPVKPTAQQIADLAKEKYEAKQAKDAAKAAKKTT